MRWTSRTWFGFVCVAAIGGVSAWRHELNGWAVGLILGGYLIFSAFSTVKEFAGKFLDLKYGKEK